MTVAVGTNRCGKSMRFDGSSPANALTPVMLPLGLLRLETSPTAIGSSPGSGQVRLAHWKGGYSEI